LRIGEKLGADAERRERWRATLEKLPAYRIDSDGALAEWAWPGVGNNEDHRHASHLYPLYDGVAPEIAASPALQAASRVAIEKRLEYRRAKNGAEMAFGLVQLGMSASNLGDTAHAYECVEWLINSYWSPAMVSQHDPGNIFNTDISGGLAAVIINMIVQSAEPDSPGAPWQIRLLPCLPKEWPEGSLAGVRCRGGFELSVEWRDRRVSHLEVVSLRGESCEIAFDGRVESPSFENGRWSMTTAEA
jgi:hypothetical protein